MRPWPPTSVDSISTLDHIPTASAGAPLLNVVAPFLISRRRSAVRPLISRRSISPESFRRGPAIDVGHRDIDGRRTILDARERERSQAEAQRCVETIKEVCPRLGHDFADQDTRRVVREAVIAVGGR
jgi:hypothetical protein